MSPEPSVNFYDILFLAHDCRITSYMINHVDHIRIQPFLQHALQSRDSLDSSLTQHQYIQDFLLSAPVQL